MISTDPGRPAEANNTLTTDAASSEERFPDHLAHEKSERLTVLLVDKRAWTREALLHALEKVDRMLRVLPITSPSDLRAMCKPDGAAVILLSVSGLASHEQVLAETITAARAAMPELPIVALADHAGAEEILHVIGRGLNGYILASAERRHVAMALRFVAGGGVFVPAEPLLEGLSTGTPVATAVLASPITKAISAGLTPRETAVLQHLRDGLSNKQIARALALREPTVKVHVHNVLRKLGAANRTQLALIAGQMARDEAEADTTPRLAADLQE